MSSFVRALRGLSLVLATFLAACDGDGGPTGDNVAPTVSSTSPADDATGVARTTAVSATFSEPIAPASATTTTFTLTPTGGSAVAGTVAVSGAVVTFTPAAPLAFGTTYTATLGTGITDVAGNELDDAHSWSFTTVVNPPPTVTLVTPANGAANVARTTTVSATFSEAVLASSVTTTSFTLTPAGGTPVPPRSRSAVRWRH